MTAFGAPVVPLEYCQKHMSSALVAAAAIGPGWSAKKAASFSVTVIAAPESRSMNASSSGRARVERGTGIATTDATFAQESGGAVLKGGEISVREGLAAVPERRRTATTGRARGVGEGARQIERG